MKNLFFSILVKITMTADLILFFTNTYPLIPVKPGVTTWLPQGEDARHDNSQKIHMSLVLQNF